MTRSAWLKTVAAVAAVVALVAFGRGRVAGIEAWLASIGAWAPFVFAGLHLVLVACFFPVSVLGLLAGAVFGFARGLAVLGAADVLTAAVLFGLSRRGSPAWQARLLARRPRLARFVELANADATRIMVLLRLSPLNFALVNYLLGASRVRLLPYLLASLLVLPSAALQVLLGSLARRVGLAAGDMSIGPWRLAMAIVGAVASVLLLVIVGRKAQRALHEEDER